MINSLKSLGYILSAKARVIPDQLKVLPTISNLTVRRSAVEK